MVRGSKGTDLATALSGKEYNGHINELIRTTAVRASDFDQKAFSLLDALQTNGRAGEACAHLKKALDGVQRERVGNWRGYIYTLLRGFDEESYNAMKASRGEGRRRRDTRETDGAETTAAATNGGGEEKEKTKEASRGKQPFDASAKEFVPTKPVQVPLATAVKQEASGSDTLKRLGLGAWDTPSWQGAPIESAAAADPRMLTTTPSTQLKHTADEFVPGRSTWSGASKVTSKTFNHSAAEFVPGRSVHKASGGNGSAVPRAGGVSVASSRPAANDSVASKAPEQSSRTPANPPSASEANPATQGAGGPGKADEVAKSFSKRDTPPDRSRYLYMAVALAVVSVPLVLLARKRR